MKQLTNIFISLVLSAVIISLGAGISFVRCCHTRTVELAPLADFGHHERKADSDCCGHHRHGQTTGTEVSAPDCMETVVVKLAPTLTVEQQPVSFSMPCFMRPQRPEMTAVLPHYVILPANARHTADAPHSPPRAWLRMINVLLI